MSLYMRNNTLPTVIENDDDEDYNNNQKQKNKNNSEYYYNNLKKTTSGLSFSNNNSFEFLNNDEYGENSIQIVDDYDDNYYVEDTLDSSNLDNSFFTDIDMNEKLNSKVFDLGLKRGSSRNRSSARSSVTLNNDENQAINNLNNSNSTDSDRTNVTPAMNTTITSIEEHSRLQETMSASKYENLDETIDENKVENKEIKLVIVPIKKGQTNDKGVVKNKLITRLDALKSTVKRAKSSVIIKKPTDIKNDEMKQILNQSEELNAKRYLAKSQPSVSRLSKIEKEQVKPNNSRLLERRQQSGLKIVRTNTSSARKASENNTCNNTNNIIDKSSTGISPNSKKLNEKMPITVDTSKANSNLEVVRLCINELGWLEMPNGSPNGCDIYWHSSTYHEGYYGNKFFCNHSGRINKFPCMNQLLRKGPLTQALNVMRYIYPEQYDFYPRTWFLPEQFQDFKTDCKYIHEKQTKLGKPLTAFIVKPNDGSQGEGIYLITDPNEFLNISAKNTSRAYIVQEYIDNPFLIDGLKSDLRIYVVLANLKPLEIHLCDEGLVRFATVNYESPDDSNLKQVFMHLTNYSLNKKNELYKFTSDKESTSNSNNNQKNETNEVDANGGNNTKEQNEQEGKGSKRKLTQVFYKMEKNGIKTKRLRNAIDDLVIKTIFALLPEIKVEYAYEVLSACTNNVGPSCFQIFGFDILLTNELKPMLLEVNCNPSLRIDYETEDSNGKLNIKTCSAVTIKL